MRSGRSTFAFQGRIQLSGHRQIRAEIESESHLIRLWTRVTSLRTAALRCFVSSRVMTAFAPRPTGFAAQRRPRRGGPPAAAWAVVRPSSRDETRHTIEDQDTQSEGTESE